MDMLTPHIDLASLIEAHLAKTGQKPTAFGMDAVGDPWLLRDLKAGREPRRKTVARIMEYMLTGKTHAETKVQQ